MALYQLRLHQSDGGSHAQTEQSKHGSSCVSHHTDERETHHIDHESQRRQTMEEAMHGDTRSKLVLCECGKFHFTYRSMTLHFEREEFFSFVDSVARLGTLVKDSANGTAHHPAAVQN